MSNYIFCFLFLSCLTDLVATRNAFLDSSGANCEADYKPNEIIDITSIEDEGKANFLGAKKSASEINCAELCCKSFTPDLPNSPQSCNTAVYFPDPEGKREESCFLLFCIDPYCGKDGEFIIKGKSYNSTYVIFLNDFHSPKSETTSSTTSAPSENGESDSNVPDESGSADDVEKADGEETNDNELKRNESSVDETISNEDVNDVNFDNSDQSNKTSESIEESEEIDHKSSEVAPTFHTNQAKYSPTSDQVGTILISLFVVLIVATSSVLIANKLYQQYQKRKMYDKLDYLSTEPLYGYGDRTDYD
ncbi:uncharacterized protein LOC142354443 [Convolutriloba macropyga]|uniref:uncharacterized protein LOC142354443 n=1 Tax=Convolutriloba macropyga TaxID=536237 RepID=UPI003F524E84